MPGDETAPQGLRLSRRGLDDLPGLQGEDGHVLRGAGGEPTPGSGGDQGAASILARAAGLRFPNLREITDPRERVDALIDYISDTAIVRGELEQLRLETETELLLSRAEWRNLPVPANLTGPKAEAARRQADPVLASTLDRARWLIDRCSEGIARFGGSDYDAASRAYTLIAGS